MDIRHLGQVFTPCGIVEKMYALRKNDGTLLEPSCGNGAFLKCRENYTAIEYDAAQCPEGALCMDFFDYPAENRFDTVIGNPPYVRFQDISPDTKKKLDMTLFDERSNLYLFFIEKSIRHLSPGGELIFIVPRDFVKLTSAIRLNEFIYESGTITDFIDLGDEPVFEGAAPNCAIFRFEKGNFSRAMNDGRHFQFCGGQLLFTKNSYTVPFSDLFYVKVGAATGANGIFRNENGNMDFVYSETRRTGRTVRMFYDVPAPELLPHKEKLLSRKLKKFDETNWYQYGRDYYKTEEERIYVNAKTRQKSPFFYHPCKAYDGSVLAVFAKFEIDADLARQIADDLNAVTWEELGFVCGGRHLFTQRSLENCMLPESFRKYRALTMAEAC